MQRPGVELAIFRSLVRRPTTTLPSQPVAGLRRGPPENRREGKKGRDCVEQEWGGGNGKRRVGRERMEERQGGD